MPEASSRPDASSGRVPPAGNVVVLMLAALREAGSLVSSTLALARIEIDGNIRALISLIAALGTIVVLLVTAFFVFLDAAVKMLAALIGSEAIAALIVAAPFLAAMAALGLFGARRLALSNLEPWRTMRQAERTARAVVPGARS